LLTPKATVLLYQDLEDQVKLCFLLSSPLKMVDDYVLEYQFPLTYSPHKEAADKVMININLKFHSQETLFIIHSAGGVDV